MATAATLNEHLEPLRADPAHSAVLLDVDGVLAPIVRHAEDAHVPEPTRVPLIAVAKRYGLVACVSGRRATTARRIVSLGSITYVGNHGAEVLRGGATEVELDPEVAAWSQRIDEWAREAWNDELHRLRVRAEDKDVIRAYHWRGAPDEARAEAAVRELAQRAEQAGWSCTGGARSSRCARRSRSTRAAGSSTCSRARTSPRPPTSATTTPISTRSRPCAASRPTGACRPPSASASDPTRHPPELEAQADVLVDGPVGVRTLLSALAA